MRTKYNKRRFRTFIMIIIILFCMSIGYSYLLTNLNIEGTSNIKGNTWDVHWENVSVKNGSVTGDQVPIQAHILSDTTQVEYSVILKNPGDYYEFTVDAKNSGSIDAMVSITDTKFYESNGVTQITKPSYLEYEFLYSNGINIEPNQLLAANSSRTIKVKLKFKDNLEESELPTTDKTIVIRHSITYVQSDENATIIANSRFEQDSWETIVENVQNNQTKYYNVGDTKEVDMGSLGKHTLRIANKSTPSECNNPNFSQTACGFVLEFSDIITNQIINPSSNGEEIVGYGCVGGWPATEMRTYVNNDIYNALPEDLKTGISNTKVVSGHGTAAGDTTNFVSIDKLYILSVHEVWEDVDNNPNEGLNVRDTAYNQTRQLDYYKNLGVTTSNYSGAIKHNHANLCWRLRTPDYTFGFFQVNNDGSLGASHSDMARGVSPAFRLSDIQS